jgi:hypothetical protein
VLAGTRCTRLLLPRVLGRCLSASERESNSHADKTYQQLTNLQRLADHTHTHTPADRAILTPSSSLPHPYPHAPPTRQPSPFPPPSPVPVQLHPSPLPRTCTGWRHMHMGLSCRRVAAATATRYHGQRVGRGSDARATWRRQIFLAPLTCTTPRPGSLPTPAPRARAPHETLSTPLRWKRPGTPVCRAPTADAAPQSPQSVARCAAFGGRVLLDG